ncbi:RdgB/HAM1 family non-canonical purine NTP pyrophosphatase [Ferrovibrio sp.]|uniref:RdgB/HAM1 family non-canonical purine NTP pyrophosphatase n=1 Tax=Ferrovibrio sp. TaxID=1917215 RepID=UPI001B5BE5A1|nr:RdgB/HAM1 family non-canonical purine NTP pyrophosphatase [Ferrovibrio sp.]MBP7064792.1 RdgB/HAM1 family non-canonical purine NTP pyrophosphatase [Ferrovibrio sp.]
MARRFQGGRLVIASHNKGKLREIADLLAPFHVETVSAGALGLPEPEETGSTFIANAELKALASATGANLPALADDSGMSVDCLGGDPGIYSARWAGPEKDFALAMRKVWDAVQATGISGTVKAQFVCALSLAWPDGHVETFQGILPGRLVWPPRGDKGFGYDPMFIADGQDLSFGEMEPAAKHAISHRAMAFRHLIDACFG